MSHPSRAFRDSLRKLAATPSSVSVRRLWRALTPEERTDALAAAFAGNSGQNLRATIVREVARERHFRPKTTAAWDDRRLAAAGARVDVRDAGAVTSALIAMHTEGRRSLLIAFLGTAGIAHDEGQFRDDSITGSAIAAEKLVPAANHIVDHFDSDAVLTYLLALRALYPIAFAPLDAWLVDVALSEGPLQRSIPVSFAAPETQGTSVAGAIQADSFTALDQRLILVTVDSAGGVTGAPSPDEIDDMVAELVELNGRRHQSFFHLGLRDALFGRPAADSVPAENDTRRRWYWAGFVNGLARSDEWQRIAQLFDEHSAIRTLGTTPDGSADVSSWIVFKALCSVGRQGEAGAFATASVVRRSTNLQREIQWAAIALIRETRGVDALQMLDNLDKALSGVQELDEDEESLLMEARRRRALCLRQTGDVEGAMQILQTLTAHPDQSLRAIVWSDIGLIHARFRRLGEIVIPQAMEDLSAFVERVAQGEDDFLRAVEGKDFRPAHANFALGVLALSRHSFAEAASRLDEALAHFASSPAVYRRDGTLALAQLYLGLAICNSLDDPGQFPRACELILAGIRDGAKLPLWLVKSTVDALALERGDLAQSMAAEILGVSGDDVLDELAPSSPAEHSTAVRSALFARAAHPSRPAPSRARDYRQVLPWLLKHQEIDKADDALGFLEASALDGVHRDEFFQLLANPMSYSPAWSVERASESRARLLEADGCYEDAAEELASLCSRMLAREQYNAVDNACLILGHIDGYGPAGEAVSTRLRPRIEAQLAQRDAQFLDQVIEDEEDLPAVRILVVGGNEQQARMDASIRDACEDQLDGVSLDFLHTGWSGNWSPYATEFNRRVARVDGVVFLSLMRTNLGWTIRAACQVPWCGTPGRGRGAILEAIKRVVPLARRYMRQQHSEGAAS